MKRFLIFTLGAIAAVALIVEPSAALVVAMKPAPQRALSADVVVIGKVTSVEKETVDAAPFPGSPQKLPYKVAVVKVESALVGAANLTHLKIGFIQPPKPPVNPVPQPGLRPIASRPGLAPPELKEGEEYLLFLVKHPEANFYVMPMMSPPVDVKGDEGKKELEAVKKVLAVTADPAKALKAEAAADRYFAAITLITKYRTYPEFIRMTDQVEIAEDESKALLKSLAEGDWTKFDRLSPNGMQAFYSLGLTDKDGWVAPKPQPAKPGQPPVNFNQLTKDAYVKWLAGPGQDYRIKRVVPKKM